MTPPRRSPRTSPASCAPSRCRRRPSAPPSSAPWSALEQIPFGASTTYGAIAAALPEPSAARAVGTAVGRNPISIVVPCHRVIGAGGALTGYAGGLDRKRHLLELEGLLAPTLG